MSRSKKIAAMLLSVTMLVSVAAGCGKTAEQNSDASSSNSVASTTNEKKEDYTLKYMLPGAIDSHSLDNEIGKIIYEETGVIIDITAYAGDYTEKCALMLAANDYPEMIQLQGNSMVDKYIKAGALLDLTELADKNGSNFKEFHKDSIPYWKMVDEKGGLYKYEANTPYMGCATGAMFDMLVRSDILEQQGWPDILDEDSYINLLKKGLEQNPEVNGQKTIGMVLPGAEPWGVGGIMTQMYDKGKYSEAAGNGAVIWNSYDEVFEDLVLNPYFKTSMKFFNKLYRAGVLDPECFTDFSDQVNEKLNSGRALSAYYITWAAGTANSTLQKAGQSKMEYVEMPIMTSEQLKNGDKRMIRIIDNYDWQSVAITKNAKNPERLMELVDWASTKEHQVLLGWGIEGKHYTIGSDGKRVLTDDYIKASTDNTSKFNEGVGTYYFLGLSGGLDENGQCYSAYYDEAVQNVLISDRKKEVYSHYGWETVTDPWQKNKKFGIDYLHTGLVSLSTLDSTSDEGKLATKIVDYRTKNTVPLIMAADDEKFESLYNKMVEGHNALKPEIVVNKYNELYKNVKNKFEAGK